MRKVINILLLTMISIFLLCSCSSEEYFRCDVCNDEYPESQTIYCDEYYCLSCALENLHKCHSCNELYYVSGWDDEMYCSVCTEKDFLYCGECGEIHKAEDMIDDYALGIVCLECYITFNEE